MKVSFGGNIYFAHKYTPVMILRASELTEKSLEVNGAKEQREWFYELADFLAHEVFHDQFTANDFINGYESEQVLADLYGIIAAITGRLTAELADFPTPEPSSSEKKTKGSPQKKRSP